MGFLISLFDQSKDRDVDVTSAVALVPFHMSRRNRLEERCVGILRYDYDCIRVSLSLSLSLFSLFSFYECPSFLLPCNA